MFNLIIFILSLGAVACSIILMIISERRMRLCATFLEDYDRIENERDEVTDEYNKLVDHHNMMVHDYNGLVEQQHEIIDENQRLIDENIKLRDERNNLLVRLGFSWDEKADK